MNAIIAMLVTMTKNLVTMMIGPKMVIWTLEKAAQATNNKIDDNVVLIVKAAYNSDEDLLRIGVERLLMQLNKRKNAKKTTNTTG